MYFEEFTLGRKWHIGAIHITREMMLDYASKYDSAPIHMDDEVGKKSIFGEIIAPGTMTGMLLWRKWLLDYKPLGHFIAGVSSYNDWYKPVKAGDVITGTAEVAYVEERNEFNGLVRIKIDGYNQNGEHVITANDTLVIGKNFENTEKEV